MRRKVIKHLSLAAVLAAGLGGQGCANMSDTDRRIGTGVGIGAVTGALISGGRPGGTAAGAVIGAGAGYLYDRERKRRDYYRYRGRYYRY
ncbi:glycine zipper domain-containing protein [Microbulbifer sp. 2205BS26-8]|uniref:glycine zipper domain-containing protein n=1 Tax=Microbulbifer sp. 2205BS26-8 TaxID=3064386 RepID=UPI002740074A|nr:glycine zipper domain-containing protein [Microbulbifer sp. 2205BS26-8]MDP5209004.1 glycine zipper domain-containing protein [Microbulbifer sp. 2205BS26-8]